MNIAIFGTGIEAWTLAACLASTGCHVDIEAEQLPDDTSDVAEPDLLRLLHKQAPRYLRLKAEITQVCQYDLILDAQHQTEAGYQARLQSFLEKEIDRLEVTQNSRQEDKPAHLLVYVLVVPVPIGCTERLQHFADGWLARLSEHSPERSAKQVSPLDVSCVFWPNFLESGRAVESFTRAGRILLGGGNALAQQRLRNLLYPFNRSSDNLMWMPSKAAEMTKIAINGMLATRISFMNELAELASQHQVDIEAVRQGMGNDPRIGQNYLYPGCGFGGSSLEKALSYLTSATLKPEPEGQGNLFAAVAETNQQQKDLLFQKFWRYYQAEISGKTVALWGVAFKPETSRVTGSTALQLIQALLSHRVHIRLYDPMAMHTLDRLLQQPPFSELNAAGLVTYADSPHDAAQNADAVFVITEWKEFWNLSLNSIASGMHHPLLLDGRNIYPPDQAEAAGMIYSGIGRGRHI